MRLHTEIFAFQVDERPGQRLFNIDCVLVTAETKRQLYFRNQILMAPTSVLFGAHWVGLIILILGIL